MARLYGKPTKFIRHVTDQDYVIEPQRAMLIPFWYCATDATTRVDGADLNNEFKMPLGSKIAKHRTEMLVTPYTVEPQKIFIAVLKLSFHDALSPVVNGITIDQAAYQGAVTKANVTSYLQFYTDVDTKRAVHPTGLIDTSGIDSVYLQDNLRHFLGRLKKAIVFDQRPLMGDRKQRVPAKVKRINDYTWYGLWVFNDAPRGGTPADTQVSINLKQYIEEWAL